MRGKHQGDFIFMHSFQIKETIVEELQLRDSPTGLQSGTSTSALRVTATAYSAVHYIHPVHLNTQLCINYSAR